MAVPTFSALDALKLELQAVEGIANPERCEGLGITGDAVYLCVHRGSRGFGEAILRDHENQFGSNGLAC